MAQIHALPFDSFLKSNADWAEEFSRKNPGFFKESAAKQAPQALWIGCSDSRVPESVVLNANPGTVFTHRNIANQFHLKDDNILAVLDYAIEHLNVTHVVVVGHLGCGGVEAAYDAAKATHRPADEPLHRWLHDLVQLVVKQKLHLKPKKEALPLIVHENVKAQVNNIRKAHSVVKASKSGKPVQVHGWSYNLEDGKLTDLKIT